MTSQNFREEVIKLFEIYSEKIIDDVQARVELSVGDKLGKEIAAAESRLSKRIDRLEEKVDRIDRRTNEDHVAVVNTLIHHDRRITKPEECSI